MDGWMNGYTIIYPYANTIHMWHSIIMVVE